MRFDAFLKEFSKPQNTLKKVGFKRERLLFWLKKKQKNKCGKKTNFYRKKS